MRRPQRVPPGVESQSHARRGEICEWCRPAADRIIAINALGCVEADEHAPIGVDGEVLGKEPTGHVATTRTSTGEKEPLSCST